MDFLDWAMVVVVVAIVAVVVGGVIMVMVDARQDANYRPLYPQDPIIYALMESCYGSDADNFKTFVDCLYEFGVRFNIEGECK